MGKIKSGILGGFSGTVGPVVGSRKGISVMRSRPPGKRRKSTDAQLRQMAKLRLMTPFVSPLTDLLNKTYVELCNRCRVSTKQCRIICATRSVATTRIYDKLSTGGSGYRRSVKSFNLSVIPIPKAKSVSTGRTTAGKAAQGYRPGICSRILRNSELDDPLRWPTEKCRQLHVRCNCIQRQSGAHLYRVFIRRWSVCVYQHLYRYGEHPIIIHI